jgi:cellulose biosynthesis protein BcsQ
MAEEKQKQEKIENKKKYGTGILHYILVMIISTLVAAIVLTQYRMQYFQKDIFRNFGIVNTTLLIQEQRLAELNALRDGNSNSSFDMNKYIKDMQEIVDSIAKKYDVILLEKGAVISGDFVDLTEEVRQRLINRGYDFLKE